jgi:hypothetical protein
MLISSGLCIQYDDLDTKMGYEYFTHGTAQTNFGVLCSRCKVDAVILPTCHR